MEDLGAKRANGGSTLRNGDVTASRSHGYGNSSLTLSEQEIFWKETFDLIWKEGIVAAQDESQKGNYYYYYIYHYYYYYYYFRGILIDFP